MVCESVCAVLWTNKTIANLSVIILSLCNKTICMITTNGTPAISQPADPRKQIQLLINLITATSNNYNNNNSLLNLHLRTDQRYDPLQFLTVEYVAKYYVIWITTNSIVRIAAPPKPFEINYHDLPASEYKLLTRAPIHIPSNDIQMKYKIYRQAEFPFRLVERGATKNKYFLQEREKNEWQRIINTLFTFGR